jgi:O-antigen ligase
MAVVFALYVIGMIAKDLAFAPFPYAMRAGVQVLALAVGLFMLASRASARPLVACWPILGYLTLLLAVAPFTSHPLFVTLQVLSLASAVALAMAYFDDPRYPREQKLRVIVLSTVVMYVLVAVASLVLAKVRPGIAYEELFAGNMTGFETRFRGLFSKAAGMSAAAGLCIGFTAIIVHGRVLKLAMLAPPMICLILTQSRSYWVAAAFAGAVTLWIYYPRLRRWTVAGVLAAALAGATLIAFNIKVDVTGASAFARLNSLSTLTGRTELWESAKQGFGERPWFGNGYTLGAEGILDSSSLGRDIDPTDLSRTTLHNGYVQSLLDAGILGLSLYALTILLAVARILLRDRERRYPEILYALLFLAVANAGESVIYSGAIFPSLCFWICAVFALGLPRSSEARSAQVSSLRLAPPPNILR